MIRRSMVAQAVLAALLTVALYAPGLATSPPHLTHDEIKFAFQAKSIADTGRDINGRLLPLYFIEPGFSVGRDPICIYTMAAVLRVLPLSETSIRLSTVLVGAAGVGLLFALISLVFHRPAIAWLAALTMALTPTYYIHSRLALSVIYPVPFALMWLTALTLYLKTARVRYAVACGVILGAGIYSYLAAAIMMPLYLAATLAVLAWRREGRAAALALVSFVAMLLPLALWQTMEPNRYGNILTAYRLYDPERLTPGEKLRELMSLASIKARLDTWWDAFNPNRLFFTGESSLQISTRRVGSFLLPVAVFLAAAPGELRRAPFGALAIVLVIGLVSAPLPGVIMLDVEIRRWLVVVPFVAIVAAFGAARWWRDVAWQRLVAAILVALLAVQFVAFARDYFGPYRERASGWFGGDIRSAVEATLAEARSQLPRVVYISSEIPWVDAYWQFYAAVRGQHELLPRTQYVRPGAGELPVPSPSELLLAPSDQASTAALVALGWSLRHVVRGLDGKPSFHIYTR